MFLAFLRPDFSSVLRGIRLCLAYLTKSHNLNEELEKPPAVRPPELTCPSGTISETDPRDWEYVAEGGSTIVFSYNGPRSLSFDGMVLRLRKTPRRSHSDLTAPTGKEGSNLEDTEDPAVDFQEHVISRLVPAEFLPHLEHVEVEPAWLEKMIVAHDGKRPEKRRVKDCIDLKRTKAVLATNLIGGKGWAVEIKPKWGFKPNEMHLSTISRSVKSHVCRFCMKKHADRNAHPGLYIPRYCPLELYSPNPERVGAGLCALWDDWIQSEGTINMLRIFVDGKVLDPTQDSSAEVLAQQIDPVRLAPHTLSSQLRSKFVETIVPILMEHPVLAKLSELQRSLDPLDIEGLSTLVTGKPACEYPNEPLPIVDSPEVREGVDPSFSEWRRFLDTHFHLKFNEKPSHPRKFNGLAHGMAEKRYQLLSYLLCATFKDCSIVIRGHDDDVKSATVSIIDLDSKGIGRMSRWERLDRDVVRCTLGAEGVLSEAERRVCVDDRRVP